MENYKKIIIYLFSVSVLSLIFSIGVIIRLPEKFGICMKREWNCIDKFEVIAEPLFLISIPLIIVLCVLFFMPTKFFRAWRWFAVVFGIIGIISIIKAPSLGHGIIHIDKQIVSWTTSILFFIISLLIILFQTYKHFRGKKKKKSEEKIK